MSADWNKGYFTDSSYTYGYYRELSPQFLKLCMLLQGWMPPSGKNYCELGFGNGVSFNVHASTGSESYYGTDFTPRHATFAQEYARHSQHNGHLVNLSFQELAQQPDLPMFDYITLHGVWSWIRPEVQQSILDFIGQKLNPGGIVYISYNTYPGWSNQQPLHKLLRLYDTRLNRKSAVQERVQDAFAFVQQLVSMPSLLSANLPNLKVYCDQHADASADYLAHEFLNDSLNPCYFDDMVQAMRSAKCEFACTATPKIRIQEINFTQEHKEFLQNVEDPLLKEQLQDFIVLEKFRRDIYTRGVRQLTTHERWFLLREYYLTLIAPPQDITLKITGYLGVADLSPEIYPPIIHYLASENYSPKSVGMIAQQFPHLSQDALTETVIILLSIDAIAPCQSREAQQAGIASAHRYNQQVCYAAQFTDHVSHLASPVTNSGIYVHKIIQLFCCAIWMQVAKPVQWVFDCLQAQNIQLLKDSVGVELEADRISIIEEQYRLFTDKHLPLLRALQVIA